MGNLEDDFGLFEGLPFEEEGLFDELACDGSVHSFKLILPHSAYETVRRIADYISKPVEETVELLLRYHMVKDKRCHDPEMN